MKLLVLASVVSLVATSATAQLYGYQPPPRQQAPQTTQTYDWRSGNSYTTTVNPDGSAEVRGMNMQNGSMWNQRIEPNGDQRGSDSRGNMWNYNAASGSYMNTDGTTCIGTGALRTCSSPGR